MIFPVSNDGIDLFLDFGLDSITLTVKALVHEIARSSRETPLSAWTLFLFQRQDFLNKHLARVPITSNQEGTVGKRGKVL